METIWELQHGKESYGSIRGGLGKEKVRFEFDIEREGFYYFVCSLPFALNQKGRPAFEKLKIQNSGLLRRWTNSHQSRFSVNLRLKVYNMYGNLFKEEFVLDLAKKQERYDCFEVPPGYVPCRVEVELEGHSFFKKLHVVASLHRYGAAPRTAADQAIIARMGQFLMTNAMSTGKDNFEAIMKNEKKELMRDTQDFGIFRSTSTGSGRFGSEDAGEGVAIPPTGKAQRAQSVVSISSGKTHGDGAVVYEVESMDPIGDAMFYLLDKRILSAPVWDEESSSYLGIFDVQDATQFTLKLREASNNRQRTKQKGDFYIHGVKVGEKETSSWFGLDLPVKIFFREKNQFLAPWVPLSKSTRMQRVMEALGNDAKRIPVIDPSTGRVVKVISESEIVAEVFRRFIRKKSEFDQADYFNTTELNERAVSVGLSPIKLDDYILDAFCKITASTKHDALPVVDKNGKLVSTLTAVDSWFVCKTELEEDDPAELSKLTVRQFFEIADEVGSQDICKARRQAVAIKIDTPLQETISLLVRHKVHGVYVCDEENRPIGRVNVAGIVKALHEDQLDIFSRSEDITSVFMWESHPPPKLPTVNQAVRAAAQRCAARKKGNLKPKDVLHEDTKQELEQISAKPLRAAQLDSFRSNAPNTNRMDIGNLQVLLSNHLPLSQRAGKWVLRYNLQIHGSSTLALREAVAQREEPVVIILEDSNGYQFGGFLPSGLYMDESTNTEGFNEGPSGDGESFVFTRGDKKAPKLEVFPWTGKNRYFRLLSVSRGFGMGGGGKGFAFLLDYMLRQGSSTESATYGNTCLASEEDFLCVNMEVHGIRTGLKK